ncbi:MAG: toll/interleukin-1 receptor domain-containing protein [Pseudomonadota bacterium]
MADGEEKPLIFISYSHRDREAKEFVDDHLGVLHNLGKAEVWEDDQIAIGDDWYEAIKERLEACSVAVLLVSNHFLKSEFCIREEVKTLLQERRRRGMMIAPILLRPCAWRIVTWLAAIQMHPRENQPLLALDPIRQDEELTAVVLAINDYLEIQAALVAKAREAARATGQQAEVRGDYNTVVQAHGDNITINVVAGPKADTEYPTLAEDRIDITRLPTSGYNVVGRDDELRMLDEAFEGGRLNVVSLRAWGGVGKSTLVNKWCEYLAADNFRGARRVFAWSFYSQGARERVTSADAFVDAALRFFGDDDPEVGSAWAKGERLAALVGREKALLFLDGLEPLQDEHQGIKDPALARLVECLAVENAGLCVITTRMPVKELQDFDETTLEKNLEYLSKGAGRALLRIKGVRGSDELLAKISEAFGNHALALDLLASYLRLTKCDVRHALNLPDLPDVSFDDGKHPRRVMAAFAKRFGEGPELDLLHIMGLFDRPAAGGCISALREPPAISGLTDHLVRDGSNLLIEWWHQATDKQEVPSPDVIWERLLNHLRDLGLLAKASHYTPDELDAHPLVREHFGARLRAKREEAWKAGHDRLYEHLKEQAEHRPDTLAEMAPLFQAVHHGCQAGRRQAVLDEVYKERIVRLNEHYLVHKLGAIGADLGLAASFFDPPFAHPAADLTEPDRAWLLSQTGFQLRALGRLGEAVAPMQAGLELRVEQENWTSAARAASNFSELQLGLGEVAVALASGEAAVDHADRSDDSFQRISKRTVLADARHQAGTLAAAHELFEEAEAIQAEFQPSYPRLYSLAGYRYCDLLLTIGRAEAAWERALQFFDWRVPGDSLLDIALDRLSLGRVKMTLGDQDEAHLQLDQSVDGLRESGAIHHIPRGLLARAIFFRQVENYAKSRRDLDEVMRIATRSGMRLFACDCHLEYARLAVAECNPDAARVHLESAEALVDNCGYHRRDPDIAELKEELWR